MIYEDKCQEMIKCLVNKYHYVRINQLRRFAKYYSVEKSFFATVGKLKNSGLYSVEGNAIALRKMPGVTDRNMITANKDSITGLEKAFVVFTDFFIRLPLNAHFPSHEFPLVLVFATEENVYEVLYIKSGKEKLAEQILAHRDKDAADTTKRIVIVDSEQQMDKLHIPLMYCFCIVDVDTGNATYYTEK